MADDDDYDPPHDFSLQTYVNMSTLDALNLKNKDPQEEKFSRGKILKKSFSRASRGKILKILKILNILNILRRNNSQEE